MAGNSNSGRKKTPAHRRALDTGKPAPRGRKQSGSPRRIEPLSKTADGLWKFLVPLLGEDAAEIDSPELQALCEFWGLYRDALTAAKENPLDKDARISVTAYWGAFERIAAKFGLTPCDRLRLDKSPPDEPDALAVFIGDEGAA